jgi:hypothetical protein
LHSQHVWDTYDNILHPVFGFPGVTSMDTVRKTAGKVLEITKVLQKQLVLEPGTLVKALPWAIAGVVACNTVWDLKEVRLTVL